MLAATTAPRSRSSSIFPLAAICCLLTLGFLIAATIVLALIPIYIPSKQATPAATNDADNVFYVRYTSDGDPATSQSGSLNNIAEINRALGLGDAAEVTEGFVRAVNDRRRRSLVNRRRKRNTKVEVLMKCRAKEDRSCKFNACKKKAKEKAQKKFEDTKTIDNLPCEVRTAGKITRIQISVVLVNVVISNFAESLLGFGVVESLTIFAVRSGFAQDPSTWLFGIVPFAGCSIVIPVGIIVTWARPALIFPLVKIEIFGAAAFGSGQSSFTCNFPIKIDVRGGGQIRDLTSNKLLILQERSLIIVRTGGSFGAIGTIIRTSSSTGGGNSISVDNTAGPLTCGVLPGGVVVRYTRIAFIAIQNGDISSSSCYLNDEAPSAEACDGGCALYIASGVRLSLASLVGGVLNINIAQIDVVAGAILELGAAGLECPFPIQINIRGIVAAIGGRVRVRIPGGNGDSSGINFFGDGRLDSSLALVIQIFNRISGIDIGAPVDLPVGLIAPFFIFTSITGLIGISIIGPGGETTTSATITSTSSTTTTTTAPSTTPTIG